MPRIRFYPHPDMSITNPATGLPIPADGVEAEETDLFFHRIEAEGGVSRTPFKTLSTAGQQRRIAKRPA